MNYINYQNLDQKHNPSLQREKQREKDNFNQGRNAINLLQNNIDINQQINQDQETYDAIVYTMEWSERLNIELQKLKTILMRKLDEALHYGGEWLKEMERKISNFEIHKKKELIQQNNASYIQKIIHAFDSMKKEIKDNTIDLLLNDFNINLKQIQTKETSKEQYKIINQFDQREICYSIAFNRQSTIMVSGAQDEIKIWKFQDGKKIECIQKIKGDSEIDYATCLVFSQKADFFISGSFDSSIKLYYNQNNKWISQACKTSHSGLVTCVILNNQEDQLISCSQDLFIFIWKVSLTQKSIQFDYQLKRHEKIILSLSINQSDTEFVSTGQDQKIVVWKKDANKKWSFNQLIDHSYSDVGCRVSYITDTVIVWQQSNQPYVHFFQLLNGMYVFKQSIQFPESETCAENFQFLFPTIYNRENKVIIQKINKKIYFIRFDDDTQQYQVDSSTISCSSSAVFGNSTQDGKYLVIWDPFFTQFSVYELFYN
ncbi:unnamed protein product [Paramecium octaurelia]|uniref:WD40-repeat-containing domain n=1 Tax=Paramecium octaurelia TaxID=43137 RepID=A0A8S1VXL2_PAROT|nr:unnamed protein product [Paramecium octaurelia]